jgi:thioredoxin reductase
MSFQRTTDVLVIGAGPAGLTAALEACKAGASVTVIDEYPEAGGQFYKQLPGAFEVPDRARLDADYTKGDALIAEVRAADIAMMHRALVWASFAPGEVEVTTPEATGTVSAKCIIVATGAYERVIPFPGWDLPGVMTPGGAQTLVKNQQVIPGKRIVLAGSGPFLLPVAKTLLTAGASIVAIVEATRPMHWAKHALRLIGHGERVREALAYRRLIKRHAVPVHYGEVVVEARGGDCVELVVSGSCDAAGTLRAGAPRRELEADVLCVGYGFVPSVQVTRMLGCKHRYDSLRGGWVPVHDDSMQTSVPGVFVAGEVAGMGGAYSAIAEGRLAGLCAARYLGHQIDDGKRVAAQRDRLHRRNFANLVNELFPVKPAYYAHIRDDTLVCRCEEVNAGEVRAALAQWGSDVNCIKGMTRCGMGYCQGRICGPVIEALAGGAFEAPSEAVGAFNVRPPVKPVSVATIADLVRD